MKRADVLFVPGVVVVVVGLAIGLSRPFGLRAQVQTSQRRPSFEVVSVKRNLSDERRNFSARPGGRLVVTNMTVKDLIAAAFGIPNDRSSSSTLSPCDHLPAMLPKNVPA